MTRRSDPNYNREYYQKNKEKILKRQKEKREQNKEETSRARKEYKKKNKKLISKHGKKYYQKNKEKNKRSCLKKTIRHDPRRL